MEPRMQAKRPSDPHDASSARKPRRGARERLFRTAAELFYRRGIRAVGVETIVAEANTTKMSLYRNFPSKDELVAEWLRDHDARFWQTWDAMAQRSPDDPAGQLKSAFAMLARHVADPGARGCPMANAAVEITEKDHPARRVIEAHKAKLRARLAALCTAMGARNSRLLTDQLFLLMEGAQISAQTPGARQPALSVARAAAALIDAQLGASRKR
jgi:AcrR family transcriptional regulator